MPDTDTLRTAQNQRERTLIFTNVLLSLAHLSPLAMQFNHERFVIAVGSSAACRLCYTASVRSLSFRSGVGGGGGGREEGGGEGGGEGRVEGGGWRAVSVLCVVGG